jgi:hypothetical protein
MARRTRKPKTTKPSRSSGGKKDPITGYTITLQGETLKSDATYQQSEFSQPFFDGNPGDEIEMELSKNAIIFKWRSPYQDLDGKDRVLNGMQAYTGDFTYDRKGRFTGGKATEVSSWTYKGAGNNGIIEEYISVDIGQSKGSSLPQIIAGIQERVYDYDSLYPELGTTSRKEDIYNFTSSKYYPNEWWLNFFELNIV